MLVRAALLVVFVASSAQAAPFDHLKEELASCLRFEAGSAGSRGLRPMASNVGGALRRCSAELDRLDRADARRSRSDPGFSPSTRAVIDGVFGRGDRGRYTGLPR